MRIVAWIVATVLFIFVQIGNSREKKEIPENTSWIVQSSILLPGEKGKFDEVAVKDPSIVYFEGKWHLFYTARGKDNYTIGYVAAESLLQLQSAPRYKLKQLTGHNNAYIAAPQVFYFEPQQTWYLIFQTRDSNYQPVYSTTKTIELPDSWSEPFPLIKKEDKTKWIDFWILCDKKNAYMYYTRGHKDVYVMSTPINAFPNGFSNAQMVFSPVHESVHVYKVKGTKEYHMFYELSATNGLRHFGLATAEQPLGPWTIKNNRYAMKSNLIYKDPANKWTEEVSHGELLRTGYDQKLEYDPEKSEFLIQGLLEKEHKGSYKNLPWKLGIIKKSITE